MYHNVVKSELDRGHAVLVNVIEMCPHQRAVFVGIRDIPRAICFQQTKIRNIRSLLTGAYRGMNPQGSESIGGRLRAR